MLPPDQSLAQLREPGGEQHMHADADGEETETDTFHDAREAFERVYLLQHLHKHDWNISRTSADIGMERSQLHRKIKAFGLAQQEQESS